MSYSSIQHSALPLSHSSFWNFQTCRWTETDTQEVTTAARTFLPSLCRFWINCENIPRQRYSLRLCWWPTSPCFNDMVPHNCPCMCCLLWTRWHLFFPACLNAYNTYSICLQAANLFLSESLAVDVQLVVTHLVVLETDQKDIKIGKRPQQTLTNFCSWKNSSSADLPSHDVAVFLTRYCFAIWIMCFQFVDDNVFVLQRQWTHVTSLFRSGICFDRDGSCQTQGLAYTGGMCAPDQACTINHDDGLQLAYTVAHEIGHT